MIIKSAFLFCVGISLLSCEKSSNKSATSEIPISNELWVDATDIYLPVTAEWTNRVEVADINGDNLIDLIFANGGNYSEPGELEPSRVFINKGPDTKFEEHTEQIFGDSKYISRVIKVRDINKDAIPDIIVGTTYQSQSQLYLGIGNGTFKNVTSSQFPKVIGKYWRFRIGRC